MPKKQVTIPMLRDLHTLGNSVYGGGKKWEAACENIHAEYGTSSTKEWTWEQYWDVFNALEEKANEAKQQS